MTNAEGSRFKRGLADLVWPQKAILVAVTSPRLQVNSRLGRSAIFFHSQPFDVNIKASAFVSQLIGEGVMSERWNNRGIRHRAGDAT